MHDEYLGDGVYASFDGFGIVLDLRGQGPTLPVTKITLEPAAFAKLVRYHEALMQKLEAAEATQGEA